MKPRYLAGAVAICAATAFGAMAQTNPAVSTTSTNSSATPVPGANSFTESEARNRIEARGFTAVSDLKKDDQGIWRGSATKDGQPVKVALDFKGNVFSE